MVRLFMKFIAEMSVRMAIETALLVIEVGVLVVSIIHLTKLL
jgi:hypothetical protein